jgi:hypothetical protein
MMVSRETFSRDGYYWLWLDGKEVAERMICISGHSQTRMVFQFSYPPERFEAWFSRIAEYESAHYIGERPTKRNAFATMRNEFQLMIRRAGQLLFNGAIRPFAGFSDTESIRSLFGMEFQANGTPGDLWVWVISNPLSGDPAEPRGQIVAPTGEPSQGVYFGLRISDRGGQIYSGEIRINKPRERETESAAGVLAEMARWFNYHANPDWSVEVTPRVVKREQPAALPSTGTPPGVLRTQNPEDATGDEFEPR